MTVAPTWDFKGIQGKTMIKRIDANGAAGKGAK